MKRALLARLLAVAMPAGSAMAVETPNTIVVRDGDDEVRECPALVVAEVMVEGDRKTAARAGFRQFAAYTFGANRAREEIAMTAPVAQQPASEKIAMTAPVEQAPAAAGT